MSDGLTKEDLRRATEQVMRSGPDTPSKMFLTDDMRQALKEDMESIGYRHPGEDWDNARGHEFWGWRLDG